MIWFGKANNSVVVPCVGINGSARLVLHRHLQLMSTANGDRLTGPNLAVVLDRDVDAVRRNDFHRNTIKAVSYTHLTLPTKA